MFQARHGNIRKPLWLGGMPRYFFKGDGHEVSVEVKNEHGQRMLTVTVSMAVDRTEQAPSPGA